MLEKEDKKSAHRRHWFSRICLGAALLCLSARSALAQGDASLDELNKHWNAAQQAIDAEDWQKALQQLERVTTIIPYEFSSRQLQARCLAKLGRTEDAFVALSTAIELGWEDEAALQADADLASLRNQPRFDELMRKLRGLREEQFVLVLPQDKLPPATAKTSPGASHPRPVVLFFHGRGESPRGTAREWQGLADELGLCIMLPKGTSRRGQGYLWDAEGARGNEPYNIDVSAAAEVAANALDWLKREHGIVPQPLVLGGFSQGAVVVAHLAATHHAATDDNAQFAQAPRALLLFGGAFAKDTQLAMPNELRIAQFVGMADPWLPGNQALRDALASQQIEHRYQELDAGHDLPRPFAETLAPVWREFVMADLKE